MPRLSAASLAVAVIGGNGIEAVHRPNPPSELDSEEQKIWKDIVNRMPAEWFPAETHGLLVQYCRLIVSARRISEMKHAMEKMAYSKKRVEREEFCMKEYRQLMRDEATVSKAITALSRSMRLSQGSTYRQEYVKKRPMTVRKPWDRHEDDDEEE